VCQAGLSGFWARAQLAQSAVTHAPGSPSVNDDARRRRSALGATRGHAGRAVPSPRTVAVVTPFPLAGTATAVGLGVALRTGTPAGPSAPGALVVAGSTARLGTGTTATAALILCLLVASLTAATARTGASAAARAAQGAAAAARGATAATAATDAAADAPRRTVVSARAARSPVTSDAARVIARFTGEGWLPSRTAGIRWRAAQLRRRRARQHRVRRGEPAVVDPPNGVARGQRENGGPGEEMARAGARGHGWVRRHRVASCTRSATLSCSKLLETN
jgi:hypothetical protein